MKSIILLILLVCTACVSTQPKRRLGPVSRLFYADYEQTWKALILALESYPIEEEDKEGGYLKTETIKGESLWQLPFHTKTIPGKKYTLNIQISREHKEDDQPIVQVSILKTIYSQRGFIDTPHRVPSNGLEEKTILYRIFREIKIDRAISQSRDQLH